MKCNCEDIETLLSGYLDGELTQSDRQRVEVLMEDCEDCAKTFEEMKKLRGEISGIEYEHMTEADRLKAVKDPVAQTGASLGQSDVFRDPLFSRATSARRTTRSRPILRPIWGPEPGVFPGCCRE